MRHCALRSAALLIAIAVSATAQDTASVRGVRLGLTYGAGIKPGVIVMPVEPIAGDSVRAIVERDLDYSDRFTVISLDTATLRGLTPRGTRWNYALFARLGASAIVVIRPLAAGYRVIVHDVAAGKQLRTGAVDVVAERYSADWRMQVHGISDEVERWVLGQRGIAQTRIMFVRGGALWVVDSDGANLRAVRGGSSALSPAWHPSGNMIAYSRLTDEGTRIVLHNLESDARRTLRASSSLNITPAFSPDGRTLVYATGRASGTEIVKSPLSDPSAARLVTVGHGSDNTSPTFSPDGRRIAFMSGRAGQPEVYIADADGTNVQLMTEFTYGGTSYRASPAWSPDGRMIAYQAQSAGGFQLMAINLRDRVVRQLTSEGRNEDPSWAPDGRHLVFTSTRSGVPQLWVLDVETGRLRQLTRAGGARLSAWSPILALAANTTAGDGP